MSQKISKQLEKRPGKHELTEFEFAFLKELNILLQFHTAKDRIMSNLLTYIAKTRLGYTEIKEGYDLRFSFDLSGEDRDLEIIEVKA